MREANREPSPFTPGDWVRLTDQPDWGVGQVQSAAAGRITVNFEHAGKRTLIAVHAALVAVADPGATEP
ncbi:MAG: DUF3553 domain-containing protein [Rhodospirillaceae bacterium]|nr:DUF3553 domain-containing protein [Rhodospirillaceae bacterium]